MQDISLTICSVFHSPRSQQLLECNYDLVEKLNPGIKISWLVADNSPPGSTETLDPKKFRVIPGVQRAEMPPLLVAHSVGSFQHAMAINKQLPLVTTRFALILDNDFFIVRLNWIHAIVSHMDHAGLTFFGSTWYPCYYAKYRYFPSVHCFFIDLARVDRTLLDFRPEPESSPFRRAVKEKPLQRRSRMPWILQRLIFWATLKDRKFIGSSRDTGWRVFSLFGKKRDVRVECVQPVFRHELHFGAFANLFYLPNRIVEKFLPDRLAFIPKKKGYSTHMRFRELEYPDMLGRGYEEYFWRGKPFAFHLRGTRSGIGYDRRKDFSEEISFIEDSLKTFVQISKETV